MGFCSTSLILRKDTHMNRRNLIKQILVGAWAVLAMTLACTLEHPYGRFGRSLLP